MTDQEGGQVRRLPGQPTLSEKQIGQSANATAARPRPGTARRAEPGRRGHERQSGTGAGRLLPAGNFIDEYQRSYSSDPAAVATLGRAFITAQQKTRVAATAKHFPGLGSAATAQDTDTGPVTLTASLSKLRSTDEVPYPAAVAAGVKLVMVSWAVYPALDASRPAGLSPTVIQQELRGRNRLHRRHHHRRPGGGRAEGVRHHRPARGQRRGAGMDLILCAAQDVSQSETATAALASALTSGQLSPATFNAAVSRVTALRASLF